MVNFNRTARIVTVMSFVVATFIFWQTFRVYELIDKVALRDPLPAGEIVKGFHIQQTVVPTTTGNVSGSQGITCFGLRFATYRRDDSGTFTVAWAQDNRARQWLVNASDLTDNAVKYFCPTRSINAQAPFTVSIVGGNSKTGSAATLWLTRDRALGHIQSRSDGRALALSIATKKSIDARKIADTRHYAFLVCWISTLLIGLLALWIRDAPTNRVAHPSGDRSRYDRKLG